jgi:hypothetical protein
MNKKIKLKSLQVKSFVTTLEQKDKSKVKAGDVHTVGCPNSYGIDLCLTIRTCVSYEFKCSNLPDCDTSLPYCPTPV